LHVLSAVAQCGSMAKAAQHLAVSQPVVSAAIADLEHTIGVRLLDRGRRGVELTIYGRALINHGAVAFDALKQGIKEIEFLMQSRLGIQRDKAITDKITPATTAATLLVRWGQRGRVGDANIKPRVRAIVTALTPWVAPSDVDLLPAPLQMRAGESWNANLALPAIPRIAKAQGAPPTLLELWQFRKELQRIDQRRQAGARALPAPR